MTRPFAAPGASAFSTTTETPTATAASRSGSSSPKPPGVDRDYVISGKGLLPGVIFAVDAYLALVRDSSLLVAVASSLTELFSRDLISLRMDQMRIHYPYLIPGLAYFVGRLTQAPEDAAFALDYVSTHAQTRAEQEQVIRALERKCEILWAQLDAIDYAYVQPGNIPPGCFVPKADAS